MTVPRMTEDTVERKLVVTWAEAVTGRAARLAG